MVMKMGKKCERCGREITMMNGDRCVVCGSITKLEKKNGKYVLKDKSGDITAGDEVIVSSSAVRGEGTVERIYRRTPFRELNIKFKDGRTEVVPEIAVTKK